MRTIGFLRPKAWVSLLATLTILTVSAPRTAASQEFLVNFSDPSHRAMVTFEGLEHFGTWGEWAMFTVTSANPRVLFPHVLQPDPADGRHGLRICTGKYFDVLDGGQPESARIILSARVGNAPVHTEIASMAISAREWNECVGDSDVGGTFPWYTEPVLTEVLQDIVLHFDPAPDVGSLVPLRMVAMGNGLTQDNHSRPPWICCPRPGDDCGWTPEPPDGNPPDGGTPEPPDGNPPDGGTPEPPDGSTPDGGTPEPPDGSGPDGGMPEPPDGSGPDGGMPEPPGSSGGDNREPPGQSRPPIGCAVQVDTTGNNPANATLALLVIFAIAIRRRARGRRSE